MTKLEFLTLCGEYAIDPALALENDAIRQALKAHDDKKVRQLIETEF